jgi:hypothetical protein
VRPIRFLLYILVFNCTVYGQQKDYAEIKFKSKLRQYTKTIPKTAELGITKELFADLIHQLSGDVHSEIEQADFTNKLWLAISNPEKFDFVYKDFSLNTIENWGKKIKFEDPDFEPNPYLAQWTQTEDEFIYFQWATLHILNHMQLMAYGEEAKIAANSIKQLALLEGTSFPKPKPNEFTYDYLSRVNNQIKSKDLVLIVYNAHYDFTVCKKENKDKIIELFEKLHCEFVQP